ncbi:hypothetical protein B0H21DRAFT_244516 [Amylocystis lapponica]|nr:hypothetical protein B0H21DRAFT_244516 [Amylocystis lapponica]
MSRQPSPGPSIPMNHAALYHPPALAASPAFIQKQQKHKAYVAGITAGVEDTKYQAKYRELKKKVKEIEVDNDRLYFKLLLAKKNIRRMNLERAILYERLAAVPPTPGRHTQELPTEDPIFHQPLHIPPEHARMIDPNDHAIAEYMRARPNARLVQGPDGRVIAVEDTPPVVGPGGVNVVQPPHGIPLVHSFRHDSGPGFDPNRQLPPLPPMIPMIHPQEGSAAMSPINDHHGHSYGPPQPHLHPHPQSHSNSSHHSRASSARPDLDAMQGGASRLDGLPPAHAALGRSPTMPGETPGERSRRLDVHELTHPHGHQLPHPHIQIPVQNMPASPPPVHSPTSTRSSSGPGRIHNHQRVGPGANINRERDPEHEWELKRERELERERDREREQQLRYRTQAMEDQEEGTAWEAPLVGPGVSHGASRSNTPSSGPGNGGSRVPSRPASDEAYERERDGARSYAPNVLGLERESGHDEHNHRLSGPTTRVPPAETSAEPRKRSRADMEGSEERGGEIRSPTEGGTSTHPSSGPGVPLADNRMPRRGHLDDADRTAAKAGDMRDDRMDEDD